jgi:hypothetical protein
MTMTNKLILAVPPQTEPDRLSVFTSDRAAGLTGMYRQGT